MSRARGQDFLTDISALVGRMRTLELVTFGENDPSPFVQESIVVGTISVPVSSALSASAAEFAPASVSAPASASVSSASVSLATASSSVGLTPSAPVSIPREAYVTPLAERLRGGAPSGSEQTSGSRDMIVIKTAEQFLSKWAALDSDVERQAFELEHSNNPEQVVVNEAVKKGNARTQAMLVEMQQQLATSKAETAAARAAADAAIAAQANQEGPQELMPAFCSTVERRRTSSPRPSHVKLVSLCFLLRVLFALVLIRSLRPKEKPMSISDLVLITRLCAVLLCLCCTVLTSSLVSSS